MESSVNVGLNKPSENGHQQIFNSLYNRLEGFEDLLKNRRSIEDVFSCGLPASGRSATTGKGRENIPGIVVIPYADIDVDSPIDPAKYLYENVGFTNSYLKMRCQSIE